MNDNHLVNIFFVPRCGSIWACVFSCFEDFFIKFEFNRKIHGMHWKLLLKIFKLIFYHSFISKVRKNKLFLLKINLNCFFSCSFQSLQWICELPICVSTAFGAVNWSYLLIFLLFFFSGWKLFIFRTKTHSKYKLLVLHYPWWF